MSSICQKVGVCLVLGVLPVIAVSEEARPKVHSDKPTYDFGQIYSDKAFDHVFEVKNVGGAPLEIKRVRSTCGCTVVEAKAHTLEPGKSTEIKVRFNAKNLSGKIKKTVYVESNDPEKPSLGLTFSGEILQAISVNPAMARFDRLDRKQPSSLELTMTNNLPEPMTVSDAQSSVPNVSVKITEIEKGKKFKIVLTASPPYQGDVLHGNVKLKTGLKQRPEHTINFFGRLPPAVEMLPSSLIKLDELDNTKEYKEKVRIVSTDGKPFEITEVAMTNWRMTPVVREIREQLEYEVEVTLRPPYEWGVNRGYITFKTKSTTAPRLTLQIYGTRPQPIRVSQASLLFRGLTNEQGGETSVTITVPPGSNVSFPSVKSTLANVKAEIEKLSSGNSFKLTATATPPFKEGRLEGEVVLETTHPEMKTLRVPIRSFPVRAPLPAVSVVPDPVLIVPAQRDASRPVVSRFIVRANAGEKVHVTKVEASNKAISTEIEPQSGNPDIMTLIRVTVPGDAKLNPEGETISIHTDHKDFPKVTRKVAVFGTPGAGAISRPSVRKLGTPRSPVRRPSP
ncbi:MAG: DUF1573 domain-containing protein [Phycisphaerae bacterium]|nr:DUF1573 domain-containing protein [Phycisphaerae bacterium]